MDADGGTPIRPSYVGHVAIENARPLFHPSNGGAASEMQKINECVRPFPPATHRREKVGQVPPGFRRKVCFSNKCGCCWLIGFGAFPLVWRH